MDNELKELGERALAVLREQYATNVFAVWFRDLILESLEEDRAVFSTNASFKIQFLESQYRKKVEDAMAAVLGFHTDVSFVYREEPRPTPKPAEEPHEEQAPKKPLSNLVIEEEEEDGVNRHDIENPKTIVSQYTFENFIVADSNKFAHAACLSVARTACNQNAQEFQDIKSNPLFIYGKSGLGKTHLLYAITNEIKQNNPGVKIIYKRAEDFTNEFIHAMQENATEAFRDHYRSADVLLIDDIQFIAGKKATENEFFHTFSSLYEEDRQIILTSDRPPREIPSLSERLMTRFEWGLPVDILPPSFELRTAIIKKKAAGMNMEVSPEVVRFLAENLTENIRQIEGSLRRLKGLTLISSAPLTVEICRRSIADLLQRNSTAAEMVDKILNVVSHKYKVGKEDIRGRKRNENITAARHVSIYLIRQLTDLSQSAIGVYFDRDHTTVINSIKNVENAILESRDTEYEIEEMIREIRE